MVDECPSRKYSNTENDEKDQGPDYPYKIISRGRAEHGVLCKIIAAGNS
jgi:hypothetical protein